MNSCVCQNAFVSPHCRSPAVAESDEDQSPAGEEEEGRQSRSSTGTNRETSPERSAAAEEAATALRELEKAREDLSSLRQELQQTERERSDAVAASLVAEEGRRSAEAALEGATRGLEHNDGNVATPPGGARVAAAMGDAQEGDREGGAGDELASSPDLLQQAKAEIAAAREEARLATEELEEKNQAFSESQAARVAADQACERLTSEAAALERSLIESDKQLKEAVAKADSADAEIVELRSTLQALEEGRRVAAAEVQERLDQTLEVREAGGLSSGLDIQRISSVVYRFASHEKHAIQWTQVN